MNKHELPVVALIAGPTASGKSALAMALADVTPSVIINADSMQVYRDLRIVTARPSQADEARHPHRLFGTIDGAEACSAARWAADARQAIGAAHAAGRLPILVGGTGLYLRTLLDGIAPVPEIEPAIRAEVRAMPVHMAHAALANEDPAAAARFAPADTTRVARALEVIRSTGTPLAVWQQQREGGIAGRMRIAPLILLPPRDELAARCDWRFDEMFRLARAEVAALVARDLAASLPVMRAIGVREIAQFMRGDIEAVTALELGKRATRQYSKRQYTWFKQQAAPDWPRLTETLSYNKIHETAIILRDKALTA